ncbi:hypothetical protein [Clostridium sp. UBA1652]|uniref:hypothetical protein n=1 Tax=Clostridium sp. UBA1652 TaxID=1946348 RepID=UPI00257E40B1|nr:hypothetical protein [Clostridium sp. UBA1652]
MNISKAIKKQKKSSKRFKILMIFIFILLPIIVLLTDMTQAFFIAYLVFIETLILLALIHKVNWEKIEFSCHNNKLKYKCGLFSKELLILCDKVQLVHTEKSKDDMEIIIISTVRFKNKNYKPITQGFLKKYPMVNEEYIKIKKLNPENMFYFLIIRKGSLVKYNLLDIIFKNCVKATYTLDAIENIKIARGQKEI